ncbi:MAG: 3-hydroxyacyl-CoA dehydrogenase family protein [Opitutaceae bacterium]|nr:3-hydroxyacyl-CoA dehydrogenase family protein [Opitutaceae bacterium]
MRPKFNLEPIGLVGLGLMGAGIATCLLSRGFRVVAHDRSPKQARTAGVHIDESLRELAERGMLPKSRMRDWRRRFRLVGNPAELKACRVVVESIGENLEDKLGLMRELESCLHRSAIVASNTSSFPISLLQANARHPGRIVGMHWAEPAHIMRYMEITPGKKTSGLTLKKAMSMGVRCGKEPTLLREDVRGFLSNRMMYAMIREACHLVESGIADIPTVDQSFRNDIGWWALLAGPFRWMDLTGIPAYAAVMEGLLPQLCNDHEVPQLMRRMVASGAMGTSTASGFYKYSKAGAKDWNRRWIDFTYEIRKLADKFAEV